MDRNSRLRDTFPNMAKEFWYGYIAPEIVDIYYKEAPKCRLNPELALMVAWGKTRGFKSSVWKKGYNAFGLNKPIFSNLEVGARAHLSYLCLQVYDYDSCPIIHHRTGDREEVGKLNWYSPFHTMHLDRDAFSMLFTSEARLQETIEFHKRCVEECDPR